MPLTSSIHHDQRVPIAIVGLSCRFAGEASTPSQFWELLKNGKTAFQPTHDRFNAKAFVHAAAAKGRQNVVPTEGGFLLQQDPYTFDAAFFNITAAEANALDPRQRLALELAYEALENAGTSIQTVAGSQTSVFMGAALSDYRAAVDRDFANYPKYHLLGTSDEMISNRISHFFDLHGPSATIQTACSSSLVATHLACQSIQSGEADMALAGGVNMILSPESTMHLNNLQFLSPQGKSKTFDADADGYGRGEGCGVLVLKRLDRAINDGNNIRAIIRASSVNSDGHTPGITMPSRAAQASLIRHVYQSNGLDYSSVQYVEAHGTGTRAGDPVEIGAIYDTLIQGAKRSSRKKLWVGSVKPNIGHLEAAAGVASIIKGVLAMENSLIPPNVNLDQINSDLLSIVDGSIVVPTKLTPWPACVTKRMSINGFGMGGTNAHLVLDGSYKELALTKMQLNSLEKTSMPRMTSAQSRLFTFSSHDRAGFKRIGNVLVNHIDRIGPAATQSSYLANLAHSLGAARSSLPWKDVCVAKSTIELREQLTSTLGDKASRMPALDCSHPRIGLVFTGQGAQWARMGIEMMDRPVFHGSVTRSCTYLRELGCDWDVVVELSKEQKESQLDHPEISQTLCSVLQIALVDELRSWGVTPRKVVGHSSGEIAAAYSIGALSHRDALVTAYFRGKLSSAIPKGKGGMMAVGCSSDEAQVLMHEAGAQLTIACVNSPSSVTISGDVDSLQALGTFLEKRGIFSRRLKVDVAYHSPHMHPSSVSYASSIADIQPISPTTDSASDDEDNDLNEPNDDRSPLQPVMISSVSCSEIEPDSLGPYYWVRNLICPVLFAEAIKEMVVPSESGDEKTVDILIEVGPHSALCGPVEQTMEFHGIKNVEIFPTLVRGKNSLSTCFDLAANLFRHYVSLDIAKINGDVSVELLTDLPPYVWNHSERYHADSRMHRELLTQEYPKGALLGRMMPAMDERERTWRGFILLGDESWLRDHTIAGTVLFPGAGMISMALEAALQLGDNTKTINSLRLRDISLLATMTLHEEVATEVITHFRPHLVGTIGATPATWWEFTIASAVGTTGSLRTNCRGLIRIDYQETQTPFMTFEQSRIEASHISDYHSISRACPDEISKRAFYESMARIGLQYGEAFQCVENCHPGHGKSTFTIAMNDLVDTLSRTQTQRPFLIHAATLDSIFQSCLGSTAGPSEFDNKQIGFERSVVPVFIGELYISTRISDKDVGSKTPGLSLSKRRGFSELSSNITMFDRNVSEVLFSASDFRLAEMESDEVSPGQANATDGEVRLISEVNWNHAFDFLSSNDINEILSTPDALPAFIEMVLHNRPQIQVVELVANRAQLTSTSISKLPADLILEAQVRYAIGKGRATHDTDDGSVGGKGHVFELSAALENAMDMAATDLIVLPQQATEQLLEAPSIILEQLMHFVRPTTIVFVDRGVSDAWHTALTSMLAGQGFDRVPCNILPDKSAEAYYFGTSESLPQDLSFLGGIRSGEVVVIESHKASIAAKDTSCAIQRALQERGFAVSTCQGLGSVEAENSAHLTYVSLLELEQPVLETLSEPDFQRLRKMTLESQQVIWLTVGNNPSFGMVDGFARVANSEIERGKFKVLHFSPDGLQHVPCLTARLLSTASDDNEFREIKGHLEIPRVRTSTKEDDYVRQHLKDSIRVQDMFQDESSFDGVHDGTASLRLTVGKPGLLDTLHFAPAESSTAALDDYEVELLVKAAGVNFRDIMASMGLVPSHGLGQEASGIVIRTGRSVKHLQPGDRVCSLTLGGAYANHCVVDSRITTAIPDDMSFEEAATVLVVHCTAYYALVKLARLRPGQSVLIHAAAGGVGQAAVQLALHLGLIVYATVGSTEKRRLLMETWGIREEHIFNSRDSSFVQSIRRVTDGRGVDAVLNSLSGELLRVSWDCLATFGTFVEIGLRDITGNMRLDMRPFRKSTTFTFLNLHELISSDPEGLGGVITEVFQLLRKQVLYCPQPMTVYPAGQVEEVFRIMQQGGQRGKMVLSFHEAKVPVLRQAKRSLKLDPKVTYLIVGGLGGLGRSFALEMAASGARNVAFISRSGDAKPEAKELLRQLQSRGVKSRIYRCDIALPVSFQDTMDQISRDMPPVKGVLHMAMVLQDVVLDKMTYADWQGPLSPKVQGSWNIHTYFDHDRPLHFMIFCSSIAGICGNPSQAQYAAGNAYQDELARFRRQQGLKAVAVSLGIMRDVGVLAESGSHSLKQWEEVLGVREPTFHALMKSVINGQLQSAHKSKGSNTSNNNIRSGDPCPAHLCIGLGTGDVLADHQLPDPHYFADVRFGPLKAHSITATKTNNNSNTAGSGGVNKTHFIATKLGDASANNDRNAVVGIVQEALMGKIAEILRIPLGEIDPTRPVAQYGVDSLVALEVRNWVRKELKAKMALLDIVDSIPMTTLAERIAAKSELVKSRPE